ALDETVGAPDQPRSAAWTSASDSKGSYATSASSHHSARPWPCSGRPPGPTLANNRSASSAALRSLTPSPTNTVVRPRRRASLIGACLQVPQLEHGQQRSRLGNRSSPLCQSTVLVSRGTPTRAQTSWARNPKPSETTVTS